VGIALNPAQRRLTVALGLSVLLHAWLMDSPYGKGAASSSAGNTPIAARIVPVIEQAPPIEQSAAPVAVAAADSPAVPKTVPTITPSASARYTTGNDPVPLQASDPTYYAAGDLDVFPRALIKPDLNAVLAASHEPASGKVRATVLIDEAGVVNTVRGVDAQTGNLETAVRELLLRTRFTPARNKDGRIVKAQVLIALDYDTRDTRAPR
jgi:hypothetical protein